MNHQASEREPAVRSATEDQSARRQLRALADEVELQMKRNAFLRRGMCPSSYKLKDSARAAFDENAIEGLR